MEEKVGITWEGQRIFVTVTEITWDDKMSALRKAMREVQRGRALSKEVDNIAQREYMLVSSIKDFPVTLTRELLGSMNSKDVEKLFRVFVALNELGEVDEAGETPGGG